MEGGQSGEGRGKEERGREVENGRESWRERDFGRGENKRVEIRGGGLK